MIGHNNKRSGNESEHMTNVCVSGVSLEPITKDLQKEKILASSRKINGKFLPVFRQANDLIYVMEKLCLMNFLSKLGFKIIAPFFESNYSKDGS